MHRADFPSRFPRLQTLWTGSDTYQLLKQVQEDAERRASPGDEPTVIQAGQGEGSALQCRLLLRLSTTVHTPWMTTQLTEADRGAPAHSSPHHLHFGFFSFVFNASATGVSLSGRRSLS